MTDCSDKTSANKRLPLTGGNADRDRGSAAREKDETRDHEYNKGKSFDETRDLLRTTADPKADPIEQHQNAEDTEANS
jgi:hypothetical protein